MELIPDARLVLRKAWSLRLMVVAGILTGCETLVNLVGLPGLPGPKWVAPAVVFALVVAAFIARLVAQKDISGDH